MENTLLQKEFIPRSSLRYCYEVGHEWEDTKYMVSKMEVGHNTDPSKLEPFYFVVDGAKLQQCAICGVLRVKVNNG